MSIVAEFVGGPLDGTMQALPEPLTAWRVPCKPPANWLYAREHPVAFDLPREIVYYRDPQPLAIGAGPAREWRWMYRLEQGRGTPA